MKTTTTAAMATTTNNYYQQQGVQFMRKMRTRDGGRKLIGGAEMVSLNPFH